MKNTSNTPIQSLEFDEIKANLKDFLRGQDQFKDYDFEGSALSVIILHTTLIIKHSMPTWHQTNRL